MEFVSFFLIVQNTRVENDGGAGIISDWQQATNSRTAFQHVNINREAYTGSD